MCNFTDLRWWPGNTPILGRACSEWQVDAGCPDAASSACEWAWSGQWPCFAGESKLAWIQAGDTWRVLRRTGAPCGPVLGPVAAPMLVLLTLLLVVAGLFLARWVWHKRQPLHVLSWRDIPAAYEEAERGSDSE